MSLNKIKNNTFHRIGDRYADYFDGNHFMGRSAMDTFDISKTRRTLKKKGETRELNVSMPGFEKENIAVNLSKDVLYVTAKREEANNFKDEYLRMELHTEDQLLEIPIGHEVKQNAITCDYSKGILHIHLPISKKTDEESVTRPIDVE